MTNRPPRVDFAQLVRSITVNGMRQQEIARQLRVSPSAVHRWMMGDSIPGYYSACQLLVLAGRDPWGGAKDSGELPPQDPGQPAG
jgi:transcriptional regulator with XRE-family HTH domain